MKKDYLTSAVGAVAAAAAVAAATVAGTSSDSSSNSNRSSNLPSHLQEKLESSLAAMMGKLASTGSDWDVLVEKPNYLAWKDKNCTFVNAKVETVLSYGLGDVFKVLVDPKRQKEVDDGRVEFEVLKALSPNTSIVYERFKGVGSDRGFMFDIIGVTGF